MKYLAYGRRLWNRKFGLLISVPLYVLIQAYFFTPACSEVDTAGYLYMGEQIARGRDLAFENNDPFYRQNHVWVENHRGQLLPKYVPGLPALMALGYLLLGDPGMYLVSPVCGILSLLGCYFLFRMWLNRFLANLALIAMAFNPVFLVYTGYPLSHAANLCLTTWGMVFLWRWVRRPGTLTGLLAGLLLGGAALVRPTSALFCLVLLCGVTVLGFRAFRRKSLRAFFGKALLLCGAYAVLPLCLLVYNYHFFGNPFLTGYALTHEQTAFTVGRLLKNFGMVCGMLSGNTLGVFFALGILGLLIYRRKREVAMMLLWILPLLMLYASYYFCNANFRWAFTRFLICTFPVYFGMSFYLLGNITDSLKAQKILATFVAAVVILLNAWSGWNGMKNTVAGYALQQQLTAARVANEKLAQNTVILTYDPLAFRLGGGKDFRIYDLNVFDARLMSRKIRYPSYWSPWRQPKQKAMLMKLYDEDSAKIPEMQQGLVRDFLKQKRDVVCMVPKSRASMIKRMLKGTFKVELIHEWEMDDGHWEQMPNGQYRQIPVKRSWGIYKVSES